MGMARALVRSLGLSWGHEDPVNVLRCHDAQTGATQLKGFFSNSFVQLKHLGISLKLRLIA